MLFRTAVFGSQAWAELGRYCKIRQMQIALRLAALLNLVKNIANSARLPSPCLNTPGVSQRKKRLP